ncbi:hypothetical protein FACS189450_04650 [Spirochaetia bacterium]|nr:hypothetical protein FACS189450_04650 [Spirochaetia bacterium]
MPLIEKIGLALEVEPYRFFIEESGKNNTELDEAINLLAKLPDQVRLHAINRISGTLEQPLE